MATGPLPPPGHPPEPEAPPGGTPGPVAGEAVPPAPPRRVWVVRLVVAAVILAALAVAGRRFYDELYRLRAAPPLLVLAIALLWLLSRYQAADVMRISLRALGHRIGRYEAFMLQMVQSYGNVILPRSGIGAVGLYLKLRRGAPFADLGAVQVLPMTLLQVFTIGVIGLACQAAMALPGGAEPDRFATIVFAAVAAGCTVLLLVPVPGGGSGGGSGGGRVMRFLARLSRAWQLLGRSRALLARVVATHALMLLGRALRFVVVFAAVGEDVPFAGALAASLLADLAFVAAVTPAGLGFREAAVVYSARMMGTTGDIAMAAAILDRIISTACNILVGQVGVWQFIQPALRAGAPSAGGGAGAGAVVSPTVAPPPAR